MSAFHVVVRPLPGSGARQGVAPLAPLAGLLDVMVDGVNVTARIGGAQGLAVLGELARAVAALAGGRRDRATLQLYCENEVWELGLEADGADVLVTVFRAGPDPEVAVHERRVTLAALRGGTLTALDDALASASGSSARQLSLARRLLDATWPATLREPVGREPLSLSGRAARGLGFEARCELRRSSAAPGSAGDSHVERSDLHSLLVRGELRLFARGHAVVLRDVPLFLVAERLLALGDEVIDAWQTGRPMFRRVECGPGRLAVRRGAGEAALALTVSSPEFATSGGSVTFPELAPPAVAEVALRLARALAQAFEQHDAAQARNLRLAALRASAQSLAARLEDALQDDTVSNPEPETYRSYAPRAPARETEGPWQAGGKMRFVPRWVATVPSIDLRATFLCGQALLVGSARETACIERASGHVVWRIPTPRAAAVVTPAGLVRLHPDGRVVLHELDSGEPRFCTRVVPRIGGGSSGAVVHAPGLPKLLVLAEGERQITAVDLVSGDVRWRHTAHRPAAHRLRRAGRLLLVTGGDSALVALDVTTGELVWRVRDRMRFSGDIAVDHDDAYALSGGAGGSTLHALDPWTGISRWSASVEEAPLSGQAPLFTPDVVAVAVKDRRGVGVRAYDRATGEPLWSETPGLCAPTTAWLALDDVLIANSAAGTLLCLDSRSGAVRFSHVFSRPVDADQPRRLEPVLRSGALFVPQHQVHVVRPKDGEVIGTVPSDLIPDLLRVDERCDVYVAEESGHLAAFGAAPRLCLVK